MADPRTQPTDDGWRAAARARCEAATEGPWRVMTETRGGRQLPFAVDAKHLTWRVSTVVGAEVNPHDAEFIAHARTDLPVALAMLDRLASLAREVAGDTPQVAWYRSRVRAILEGDGG